MKILYVGDGRVRVNWGARATSEALHDLIACRNPICGIIPSSMKDAAYVRVFDLPGLHPALSKACNRSKKLRAFVRFLFGPQVPKADSEDYMRDDPDAAVDVFLRIKDYYPPLQALYREVESCDAVALNGEGSFILTTPPRRDALFFLFIMRLAKRMGKGAWCLNAMISDCPVNGRNQRTAETLARVMAEADEISLRDPWSRDLLQQICPAAQSLYRADALFSWYPLIQRTSGEPLPRTGLRRNTFDMSSIPFDYTQPYLCVSGSSLAAWHAKNATAAYTPLVENLKLLGLPLLLVPTCQGDRFLSEVARATATPILPVDIDVKLGARILANARVFVSGRFHPTILASLGGTPCVMLGSNSHKTLSLQHVLEYPAPKEYPAVPGRTDIEAICEDVRSHVADGEDTRDRIRSTVARLAQEAEKVSDAFTPSDKG